MLLLVERVIDIVVVSLFVVVLVLVVVVAIVCSIVIVLSSVVRDVVCDCVRTVDRGRRDVVVRSPRRIVAHSTSRAG